MSTSKQVNISKIPPPILVRPSKKVLEKFKFYKAKTTFTSTFTQSNKLYIQVFKNNIKDIIKIKENFPNLLAKKVEKIHKVLNNSKKDQML